MMLAPKMCTNHKKSLSCFYLLGLKQRKTGFCGVYFFNSSFFSFSFPVFMNEGGKMDTIDVPLAYFVGFEITEQNRIDMLYKRN